MPLCSRNGFPEESVQHGELPEARISHSGSEKQIRIPAAEHCGKAAVSGRDSPERLSTAAAPGNFFDAYRYRGDLIRKEYHVNLQHGFWPAVFIKKETSV